MFSSFIFKYFGETSLYLLQTFVNPGLAITAQRTTLKSTYFKKAYIKHKNQLELRKPRLVLFINVKTYSGY